MTHRVSSRESRSDVRVLLESIPSDESWLGTRDGLTEIDLGTDYYARSSSRFELRRGVGGGTVKPRIMDTPVSKIWG